MKHLKPDQMQIAYVDMDCKLPRLLFYREKHNANTSKPSYAFVKVKLNGALRASVLIDNYSHVRKEQNGTTGTRSSCALHGMQ